MIKKLYDKCVTWAGHKYANPLLAFVAFIESSFFPAPPDVMIIPMVVAKRKRFVKIALIATIFSALGGLFGYFIGYVFFNEVGYKIFEFYGYENTNILKEQFSTKGGFLSWIGILFRSMPVLNPRNKYLKLGWSPIRTSYARISMKQSGYGRFVLPNCLLCVRLKFLQSMENMSRL